MLIHHEEKKKGRGAVPTQTPRKQAKANNSSGNFYLMLVVKNGMLTDTDKTALQVVTESLNYSLECIVINRNQALKRWANKIVALYLFPLIFFFFSREGKSNNVLVFTVH